MNLPRQRSGSVLLITVVLLLILAIMGTSYLLTSRMDRLTSGGDVASSQLDTLLDGTRDLALSYVTNSLFAYDNVLGYQFREASQPAVYPTVTASNVTQPFQNYDVPQYTTAQYKAGYGDSWLADRVPQGNNGNYGWFAITEPLNAIGGGSGTFESPIPDTTNGTVSLWNPVAAATSDLPLIPTFSNGYPAFKILNGTDVGRTFIAGDADGDGIADCGLIRLPGVYADGLTYYAGIRIIDNNSAVNVNTAWDSQFDYDFTDNNIPPPFNVNPGSLHLFPSYFTSGVGLFALINGNDEGDGGMPVNEAQGDAYQTPTVPADPLQALTHYRMGTVPGAPNYYGNGPTTPQYQQIPVADTNVARNVSVPPNGDFYFSSLGDAMYHQSSRRLNNPGFSFNSASANPIRFQTFGDADAAALAYHFGMVNPSTFGPASGALAYSPMTPIEQIFASASTGSAPAGFPGGKQNVTFQNAPNYPGNPYSGYTNGRAYLPSALTTMDSVTSQTYWQDNFDNALKPYQFVPNLRPFLVTRNGVSIQTSPNSMAQLTVAAHLPTLPFGMMPYGDRGRWQQNVYYAVGDVVTFAQTTGGNSNDFNSMSSQFYTCVTAHTNSPPTQIANWALGVLAGGIPPIPAVPNFVKANVNTALFPELWRAFWNVMYFGANPAVTPQGTGYNNCQPMFRPTFRDPTYNGSGQQSYFKQMQLLRSALAAVNVENLRSPDSTAAMRSVIARAIPFDTTTTPVTYAIVYGCQPQPYITEIYANTDITTGNGNGGYVAIELYNPNSFDINLQSIYANASHPTEYGWALATIDRTNPGMNKSPVLIAGFGYNQTVDATGLTTPYQGSTIIPSGGYLLLENYAPAGSPEATNRPGSTQLPSTGPIPGANGGMHTPPLNTLYVPKLAQSLLANTTVPGSVGRELVILRRRHADGSPSTGTDGVYSWDDSIGSVNGLEDWVPIDSFDFTHMAAGGPDFAQALHYARPGGPNTLWQCVYPGPLNVPTTNGNPQYGSAQPNVFQPAAQMSTWYPKTGNDNNAAHRLTDFWINSPPTPGMSLGAGSVPSNETPASVNVGFNPHVIQLSNPNWAGPNKPTTNGPNYYPFGGFVRNGDILEVPYIGAYEICQGPPVVNAGSPRFVEEINSVTMDASFADGQITPANPYEQVGRFCPLDTQVTPPGASTSISNLCLPINQDPTPYGWARSLFDYLTVQSPRDDYFPNIDPNTYPAASPLMNPPYPNPVANSDASLNPVGAGGAQFGVANTDAENTESVQGLVNINTAPAQVLQVLPLLLTNSSGPHGAGQIDVSNITALAQAIVTDRQTNGPFYSIFDLNRIKDTSGNLTFLNGNGSIGLFNGSTVAAQGNLTAPGSTGTGITNEFDETFLQMTRLSNLITTRSDTFTVYIVVEGWSAAGTANAKLVTTRRAAYIVDRNTVTPTSRSVRTVNVPNN